MTPESSLLGLLSELYADRIVLQAQNEQLRAQLQALQPDPPTDGAQK